MNYGRIVVAAIAATIVDAIYGFLVYGLALTSQFARYPAVFRPADLQAGYMPIMFLGIFVGMLAASAIYAKGYEGGPGAAEGARFGALVGVFIVGYMCAVNYAILSIGRRLAASMAIAALIEWLLVGATIGLVYKTAAVAERRPAQL